MRLLEIGVGFIGDRSRIYLTIDLYIVRKLLKDRANCVEKHRFQGLQGEKDFIL